MAKKKSKRIELGAAGSGASSTSGPGFAGSGLTHSPFASLRGTLGAGQPDAGADGVSAQPAAVEPAASRSPGDADPLGGTVIVRHERKGHGGKTVTVADLSRADGALSQDLEGLAKTLRKALGAGARADDRCVTVQGDLVERVAAFFETKYGVKVILGTR